MSNYWKKKLDELNAEGEKKSAEKNTPPDDYWGVQQKELEESESKKNDIAPIKTETQTQGDTEEKRTWFKSGAFDDGYQIGDITRTILGTTSELRSNFVGGVLEMGEKVVDAGAYLVGGTSKLFGGDKFAGKTKEFIAKDLYDGKKVADSRLTAEKLALKLLGSTPDEVSLLGDKSGSLVQSGGQLVGTIGLQAVGVPWFVTSGVTSFGAETENAFNEGAGYLEAGGSALVSAAAEVLTEKLFGGSGLGEKGLLPVQDITKGISNKLVKTLLDFGIDLGGEGVEEVVSQFASNLGSALYKEENLLDILFSEEALDGYLESFFGGLALGGVANVPNVANSINSGRDYRTGLTANEQLVLDAEIKKRIAEEEADGKNLNKKDKDKISAEALETLKKGGISTEFIEDVLRDADFIPVEMADEDSYLWESYNEQTRKKAAFEADINKYDEKQRETIQKAIDSGILNNTNRSHEFVDMVAKISAEKGVKFDFADNERLKNSGFAIEGKTVNGFVTKDGVTLNIDSSKSLNSVVGHEIAHVLEGTELYTELQNSLFEYAKSKGDYDGRLTSLSELYKGIKDVDINAELTADLVGDYLFTDSDFINNLSTKHRNVFQKLYDEIKYLCKVATAGSKEARELEKVRHAFDKAYKESGTSNDGTKYSLSEYTEEEKKAHNKAVVDHFGKTYSWAETGYLLLDGTKLDLSGKHDGAPGGYRTVDHRDITEALGYDYGGGDYSGSLIQFMSEGNIRIIPECNGINLSVKPTKAQEEALSAYISRYRGEVLLDIDDLNGNTVVSVEYPYGTYYTTVLNDIREWFDNGKKPEKSGSYSLTKEGEAQKRYGNYNVYGEDVKLNAPTQQSENIPTNFVGGIDNKRNLVYNGKRGDTYARTDEFRSLQAESQGMSDEEWNFYLRGGENKDVRGRVSRVLQRQMGAIRSSGGFNNGVLTLQGKENQFNLYEGVDGAIFHDFFEISRRYLRNGELVDLHTVETTEDGVGYNDCYNYLSEDGLSGFSITPDGDLISVFNASEKGGFLRAIAPIVREKAKTLDCFASPNQNLVAMYQRAFGFKAAAVMDYNMDYDHDNIAENHSMPKVAFMVNTESDVETRAFTKDEYDEAVAYRNSFLNQATQNEVASFMPENAISPLPTTETKANTMENSVDDGFEDISPITEEEANTTARENLDSLTDEDAPPEVEAPYYAPRQAITIDSEGLKQITDSVNSILYLDAEDSARMSDEIQFYAQNGNLTPEQFAEHIRNTYQYVEEIEDTEAVEELSRAKKFMRGTRIYVPDEIRAEFNGKRKDGYNAFRKEHMGHFYLTSDPTARGIDSLYKELSEAPESGGFGSLFPDDIINPADQLKHMGEIAARKIEPEFRAMPYDEDSIQKAVEAIENGIAQYSQNDMLRLVTEERDALSEYYGETPIAPIAEEAQTETQPEQEQITEQPTNEPVAREVFTERMNEIYGEINNLSSGKFHQVDDYGFHIARAKSGHATITIKTPDGQKLQKRISEGAYWKNDKLWREAARMVAESEYPNVQQITAEEAKKAQIITDEPEVEQPKRSLSMAARKNLVDEYSVFEDLALKKGNRELDAKANYMRYSEQMAQRFIGKGTKGVRAIADVQAEVEKTGLNKEFQDYMYNMLNTDRMSIEANAAKVVEAVGEKFKDLRPEQIHAIATQKITDKTTERTAQTIKDAQKYLWALEAKNLPVYGYEYTAEMSNQAAAEAAAEHPEFTKWAQDIYDITNYLRNRLVKDGEISQETADLWSKLYPHYVPIRRVDKQGNAISVPLDTGKTGVNAPIKRATGGDSNIGDLFKTLALRAEQTYRAGARNSFGVELMNTLGTRLDQQSTNTLDADAESAEARMEMHEERLKKGEFGGKPTFTVFENGNRVEFEITEDMYDALKPKSQALSRTIPGLSHASELHKKVLTEYNLAFSATNAIKDAQSVIVNSQHPVRTYAEFPRAVGQLLTGKGKYVAEYKENGGENLTYFERDAKKFKKDDSTFKKIVGFPLEGISAINNFVEKIPRLAEYIASREAGASIETAMLDAARVTTNFQAGGDVTRFANRNGATFLNASVQGAAQQVRNIREAKAKGLKGILGLTARYAVAGLPVLLFNSLMWDDDEDYEELSDYVKDNYYVVAKFGDGQFVRIPKGREIAVIQKAFQEIKDFANGEGFDALGVAEIAWTNVAPNNPISNNVIAPIAQAYANEAWYGGDIVPSRLQDVPAEEQYDESIDAISKWLGEKTGHSPYKINYILDQYTGIVGDMFLPMFTPEAEGGGDSVGDKLIAPIKDKFTTDSVMNNKVTSELYDLKDELTKNAKSVKATDEDILKSKYINSVNEEISELYKKQREIQNSDMTDGEKYKSVRDLQKQINDLAEQAQSDYESVSIDGGYATVGNRHYRLDEGTWTKISDTQLERQNEVTAELGISPAEYWSKTDISFIPKKDGEYEYAYENPGKYGIAKAVGGYDSYKQHANALYNIKADKDEDGKTISGSRKDKVVDYINGLDLEYGEKIILFKSEYNADDTYNYEIIDYLNNRDDISYSDMVTILEELGFTVDAKGNITWD